METKKPELSQGQARYDASVLHRNLRRPEPVRALLPVELLDSPDVGEGQHDRVGQVAEDEGEAGAGVKAQAVAGQARTLFCHGILPGCGK